MKKIALLAFSLLFVVCFSQQKQQRIKKDKSSFSVVKKNKDSTTFEYKNSKRTLYQTKKKVWDKDLKDSVIVFTHQRSKPKK